MCLLHKMKLLSINESCIGEKKESHDAYNPPYHEAHAHYFETSYD